MVKAITKYVADDGAEFNSEQDAHDYEYFLAATHIAQEFIAIQDDVNSSAGISNSPDNIVAFAAIFREILQKYTPSLVEFWDANTRGIIGRYLCDDGTAYGKELYKLYYRCVLRVGKKDGKSYGQPFYANQH